MVNKVLGSAIASGAAPGRLARAVSLGLLFLLAVSPARAGLKIRPVFRGGVPPSASDMAGGGDLQEIFTVAAEAWERVFKIGGGYWQTTIQFEWTDDINHDLFGKEQLVSQGGNNPVRMTESRVFFNNKPEAPFFADPTPRDSTEYQQFSSYLLEGTAVNRARIFHQATGDAADRIDLLTIATHEIGHALGLDDEYVGLRAKCPGGVCLIEITPPRPFAGLFELVAYNPGPHFIPFSDDEGLIEGQPLMIPTPIAGQRQLISALDALLVAEVSSFPRPNLDPDLPFPW